MIKKHRRKLLVGLVIVLVLMQLIPIDKTQPPTDPAKDFVAILQPPDDLRSIIKAACYDCHSHETIYPWYSNIAPISFWLKSHVNEAREHLNFSDWGSYPNKRAHHKLEECYEEVEEGHMPLPSYTWMHPEAKITEAQRRALANWFNRQMTKYEHF